MAKQELSLGGTRAAAAGSFAHAYGKLASLLMHKLACIFGRFDRSIDNIWRDQGKVQQARELLAPVYGWFTEGFDTRDLKDAKVLLEELAS